MKFGLFEAFIVSIKELIRAQFSVLIWPQLQILEKPYCTQGSVLSFQHVAMD